MLDSGKQELVFRRILIGFSAIVGIAFALQAVAALWATHGITEVEAIIAAQATALSRGSGLYYDLNQYPFTVSPYGPTLYGIEAIFARLVDLASGVRSKSEDLGIGDDEFVPWMIGAQM